MKEQGIYGWMLEHGLTILLLYHNQKFKPRRMDKYGRSGNKNRRYI
jgi:hypothetical protein